MAGTAQLVMSPLEFTRRLAALVMDTRSQARDAHASDRFAVVNSGVRMRGLSRECEFVRLESGRSKQFGRAAGNRHIADRDGLARERPEWPNLRR